MKRMLLGWVVVAAWCSVAWGQSIRAVDDGKTIVVENGQVGLTWDKGTGHAISLRAFIGMKEVLIGEGKGTMYFDANTEEEEEAEYLNVFAGGECRLQKDGTDSAEIVCEHEPDAKFPFAAEMHLIFHRGERGIYAYVMMHHGAGMAAGKFVQARIVMRGIPTTKIFTDFFVQGGLQGPYPTGNILKTVQDTTWLYPDGVVHSKYDYCSFIGENGVFGMAGHGVGLWIVQPSREYVNGGPLRQELTVHEGPETNGGPQQNIMQWMVQSGHYGAGPVVMKADQEWSRFYGPVFFYVNQGGSTASLWADAQARSAQEERQWPYGFVNQADYPLARGAVRGRVKLADGQSVKGAWVVLTAPEEKDWCLGAIGYEFWTRADADGKFTIGRVRPGDYTLFVSGGNQFEDLRHEGVKVSAGKISDLGTIDWQPVTYGKTIWEIGKADRSSEEFKDGDNFRHYDNFIRYVKNFPEDVSFTIGKSDEKKDWNFAQFGWYAKKSYWSIFFDQPTKLTGKGTLTLGIAAWSYAHSLQVMLNGKELKSFRPVKSGAAVYRSGGQDSLYQVFYLPFDASLIHAGRNEIRLALTGAIPFADPDKHTAVEIGGVIYDAIRLEVDPNAVATQPSAKNGG